MWIPLAIVSNTAWMYIYFIFTWNHFSIYPGVLQPYMIVLPVEIYTYMTLYTNLHNRSANLHPHSVLGFLTTSHSFSSKFIVCFLETSHLVTDEMAHTSHLSVVLFCISIWLRWMNIFHILIRHLNFFPWEMQIHFVHPCIDWVVILLIFWVLFIF